MKKLLFLAAILNSIFILAQTPCTSGTAGAYDCENYDLMDEMSLTDLGAYNHPSNGRTANDSWGWTDPMDSKEYAIIGLNRGTAFLEVLSDGTLRHLGQMGSHNNVSTYWRDVKVYSNHAYVVSEASGHGMQVFDLTRLRGLSTNSSRTFAPDTRYTNGVGDAHNIVINEDTGYAYIVGSSTYNGGPHFVDLSTPGSPVGAGGYDIDPGYGYSHDAQVITYNGPDAAHVGKEIYIGSHEDRIVIMDVTNKAAVIELSEISYSGDAYTHQGWFTDDQRYFLLGDEQDEYSGPNAGNNTRTIVYDLLDLDSPVEHFQHFGATLAIDHNGYVRGNRFYMANYSAGMRVLKVDEIAAGTLTEVGSFDTYTPNNNANFTGAWNVYPYFESGNIIISNFNRGLFVVKDPNYDNTPPTAICSSYTATLDKTTGAVSIVVGDVDGGSTDNIGIIESTITGQTSFTCADVGSTINVTLTVEDDYGFTSSCVAAVTIVGETTEPLGAGTWTNGAPGIGSNVKISSDYDMNLAANDNFVACTCEIDTNRTLTVAAGKYIEIEGDIDVNGTGSLIVEHEGIVVQTDPNASVNKDINATINVELTTPVLSNRDFMVMGSPMDNETRTDVFSSAFLVLNSTPANFMPHAGVPMGGTNFADDKLNNGKFWSSYSGAITIGEGFIVRPQLSYTDPAVTSYDMTYELGTLNNGDVSRPIVFNGLGDNPTGTPNILANPYASPISATALVTDNALINEVYFWEHLTPPSTSIPGSNNMNFSMDDISIYNNSMPLPAVNDPGVSTTPNGVISTGQGFAIKAQAAGTVTFTNSMRLTSGNNTLRNPVTESSIDRLMLEVRNADYAVGSYTGVAFNPAATTQIDPGYDTNRLATVVSLFSHLQDGSEELAIQTMPQLNDSMKIPLGFTTQVDAELEYVISIASAEGNQISTMTVYLVDNLLNTTTNLSALDYTFRSGKDTYSSRFTLLFESRILGPNDSILDTIAIFPNPTEGIITISSPHTVIHDVEVYDIRGRRVVEVLSSEDNQYTLNLASLETTIYFVKVHTEAGTTTKKIIKK